MFHSSSVCNVCDNKRVCLEEQFTADGNQMVTNDEKSEKRTKKQILTCMF